MACLNIVLWLKHFLGDVGLLACMTGGYCTWAS